MKDQEMFVPPGHFYSPIADIEDVKEAGSRRKTASLLPGIKIDTSKMTSLWLELEKDMIGYEEHIAVEPKRFRFDNGFFDYGDALVYRSILKKHRPRKVIEIGSGYSSALLLDTIDEFSIDCHATFVEPYPSVLKSLFDASGETRATLIQDKVQKTDLDLYSALQADDILFIDSSHVLKTGSDVAFELFEILPILQSNVLIHIHDIFDGFEYPRHWIEDENRSWNEAYAVRALLYETCSFEIYFFNEFFYNFSRNLVDQSSSSFKKNPGGSIWLRKI